MNSMLIGLATIPGVSGAPSALGQDFYALIRSTEHRPAMELAKLEYSPKGGVDLTKDIVEGLKDSSKIVDQHRQLASTISGD